MQSSSLRRAVDQVDQVVAECDTHQERLLAQKQEAAKYIEAEFQQLEILLRQKRQEALAELDAVEERKRQESIRWDNWRTHCLSVYARFFKKKTDDSIADRRQKALETREMHTTALARLQNAASVDDSEQPLLVLQVQAPLT